LTVNGQEKKLNKNVPERGKGLMDTASLYLHPGTKNKKAEIAASGRSTERRLYSQARNYKTKLATWL